MYIIMRNDLERPVVGPFATEEAVEAWIKLDETLYGPASEQTVWPMVTPEHATAASALFEQGRKADDHMPTLRHRD